MSARRNKNRNSWSVDFQIDGIRYRQRSPENTGAGAKAYEAVLRQRLARGESIHAKPAPVAQEVKTFEVFCKEWFNTYVLTNSSPKERVRKESALRVHIIPFFGARKLTMITNRAIEEFKASLQKQGLAPNSVNNTLNVLTRCLRSAVEWGELGVLPNVKRMKVPPTKFDFLSPEETDRLFAATKKDMPWHLMLMIAARTGMRFGEIIVLEWGDVDFERRTITIQRSLSNRVITAPKNNKKRFVPIAPDLFPVLWEYRQQSGLVLPGPQGDYLTHSMGRTALEKYRRNAAIRKIGWHTLRHSFASQLVSRGVSLRIVQELLGHSDMRVTLRYAHLAPSSLRQAINLLTLPEVEEEMSTGCQRNILEDKKSLQ